ncbi:MAG: hypothetical protein P1U42_09365 [Phycisphaerales bacterium]|jgi:hypothetical protein|nr:hypothetical protein [Phycisphaerales bacterium]
MSESSDIEIVSDDEFLDPSEYLANLPTKLVSGVLGLVGFSTALLIGLIAGNPGYIIILRAIVAMVCCAFVGRILGAIGEVCVREFVTNYKSGRPVPQKPQELVDLDMKQQAHASMVQNMKKAA